MATDLTPAAPRRTALWITLGLGLAVVGLVAVLATSGPAASRVADSPLIGRPVPSVQGTTIDGADFDLATLRGRWVLVNFFATWCVPCRQEHPDLIAFHNRHERLGDATVVGIIYDDDTDAVRRFRTEEGGTWPMVQDPDGQISLDFGVAGVPESFLVAPDGTVVAKLIGGVNDTQLERLLTEATGGTP